MLKLTAVIFIYWISQHCFAEELYGKTIPLSSYLGPSSSIYDVPFGLYNFQLPSNEYKNKLLIPEIKMFGQSSGQTPSLFKNSDDFSKSNNEYTKDEPIRYTVFTNPFVYPNFKNDLVVSSDGKSKNMADSSFIMSNSATKESNQNPKLVTIPNSQSQYYSPLSTLINYPKYRYPIGLNYENTNFNAQSKSYDGYKSNSNSELLNSNSEISSHVDKNKKYNPCNCAMSKDTVLYYYKDPCYETNDANILNIISPSSNNVDNIPAHNLGPTSETDSLSGISQSRPTEKSNSEFIRTATDSLNPTDLMKAYTPQPSNIKTEYSMTSKINKGDIPYDAHNLVFENIMPSSLQTNVKPYPLLNGCRCYHQNPSFTNKQNLPEYLTSTDYSHNSNNVVDIISNSKDYNIQSPLNSNTLNSQNRSSRDSQQYSSNENLSKFDYRLDSDVFDKLNSMYKQRGMFTARYPGYQNYNYNYGFNRKFPLTGNSYSGLNYNQGYGLNQYGHNAMYSAGNYGMGNPMGYGSSGFRL